MQHFNTFITYTFSEDDLSGPVKDPSGKTIYLLSTTNGILAPKSTTISRASQEENSGPAAEIYWGSLTKSKKIVVNGNEIEKFLKEKRTGVFTPSEWWFSDEDGNEYYWKEFE
ncbi:hypothetical protein FRC01_013582, partial [Tulasnella sp. 417]